MATLSRSRAGNFDIEKSVTLNALEEMGEEERKSLLLPIDSLFSELPQLKLPAFYERLSRNGCEIYQKKIKTSFSAGERVRLCADNGNFYALGEVREYPEGTVIKAIKIFDI